ncbi:MAG: 30S ribosomal protein S9 [Verrucomicrobiota bacterium]
MSTTSQTSTGRCRTSVALAQIVPGAGKITVNKRNIDDYFTTLHQRLVALQPLFATENHKKVDVTVRAHGGGLMGQAGAMRLAIARGLIKQNPELRGVLKAKGLLTRDSRMKERKKPGRPGARKRFQFSKR